MTSVTSVIAGLLSVAALYFCCFAMRARRRGAVALWSLAAVLAMVGCVASQAHGADVRIPDASHQYRRAVERASAQYFGLHAAPARLAAQLHQESGWRPDARSPYAVGLAQFVPSTAEWLPQVCPELGPFDPWDPLQSVRAAACYNHWHYRRIEAADECARWAMALSAYNGGLGWLQRDRRLAAANGADPDQWFGAVELWTARAAWARAENRGYVLRILKRLEPAYINAGWLGDPVCP